MATQAEPLTPPEFARRYRISAEKVIGLILTGELGAIDVRSTGATRPRWRILPEHIEAFERRRAAVPPPPKRRKRRQSVAGVKQYF